MRADGVFGGTTAAMDAATGGAAWLAAMLDAERALAVAVEAVGLAPAGSGAAVDRAAHGVVGSVTPAQLGDDGIVPGTPVVPLVRALRNAVDADFLDVVHRGATSQDIIDTAMVLVARAASALLLDGMAAVSGALATVADDHRHTVMAGRTLLQQAEPTTFGAKVAGWLDGVLDARDALADATDGGALPAQLGGAVGNLAGFGVDGADVVARFAAELGLCEPVVPWHTNRAPVARLAAALAIVNAAMAKVAGDVVLLAQTEVGEVSERAEPGRGVSSAMPHKRNPVASVAALAAVRRARPLAGELVATSGYEHERSTGGWQAEAPMLCDLYRHTAAAVDAVRDALDGLEVHAEQMRENVASLGGTAAAAALPASADVLVDRVLARFHKAR